MPNTPALARWWREPWWARLTLASILLAFAVLTVWNLARGGDSSFYEASARSMSESGKALLFGAFDPAATVSLDKLSGFAVPQALSVRLFGMSTSALALPQVIEGLITVFACSLIGLRWLGRVGGLVAAGATASTPIFVSMFAHPMEDGLLTMALAVALLWWQRAMLTARAWPLLLAGLFIGVGFQAKMMQAWFVLPAMLVGTLLAVGGTWRSRVGRSGILIGSAVAFSLSWIVMMQLVPAASRPFVDGSTDDDVFAMVFGYNGIDRLVPNAVAGAVHSGGGASSSAGPGGSVAKLLDPVYVTQIGWLYPAALFGIGLGIWSWVRRRRAAAHAAGERTRRATFVVVTVWLVTGAAILSAAHMPHTAYLAAIGVQLALLSAFGVTEAVRMRTSSYRRRRWVLPALVLCQGAWAIVLAVEVGMPPALAVAMLVLVAISAVVTAAGALTTSAARWAGAVCVAAAAVGVLGGPALSSAQVLDSERNGSGGDAYVGIKPAAGRPAGAGPFAVSAPQPWGGGPGIAPSLIELLAAARSAGGGADGIPLFLTDTWSVAAPIIDATGEEVLTDGGYSGQAEVFTAQQVREKIAAGVHLVVVKDHPPALDPVAEVVRGGGCAVVRSWPSGGRGPGAEHDGGSLLVGFTLYSCPSPTARVDPES